MLPALSNFFIALLELLEAELKGAQKGALQLLVAAFFMWVAASLVLGALGLVLWAIYVSFLYVVPAGLAALFCALIALIFSGGVAWLARLQLR